MSRDLTIAVRVSLRVVRAPLVGLLVSGLGCATLQPVREPGPFISKANPRVVYVTFKNHSKVTITEPRVSTDSLFGFVPGVSAPVGAPLSHIQRVEAVQRDKKRTTWLVAGLGVLAATSAFVLARGGSSDSQHPCERRTEECEFGSLLPNRRY